MVVELSRRHALNEQTRTSNSGWQHAGGYTLTLDEAPDTIARTDTF